MAALAAWYESERPSEGVDPDRYVVCAGLALLEIARDAFPLEPGDYITDGSQVKTNGSLIKKILKRFGETRNYASEGGRTTRGTRPAAERFAAVVNSLDSCLSASAADRGEIIDQLQGWLAERAKDYFNRRRIEVELHLDQSSEQIVSSILDAAAKRKCAGPVAQHLVGAKLALRFPEMSVENYNATTADMQLGRSGDFLIGDTIFHVTVAPMVPVFEKCRMNLKKGYRAFLLVPDGKVQAARQIAEGEEVYGKIGICSIESFVGQNVEEMGEFRKELFAAGLRALLDMYNARVAQAETNLSLLIEIPENL